MNVSLKVINNKTINLIVYNGDQVFKQYSFYKSNTLKYTINVIHELISQKEIKFFINHDICYIRNYSVLKIVILELTRKSLLEIL